MLSGKFVNCFKLAGRWAPEALDAAIEGLEPVLQRTRAVYELCL